jgi:hypothetical protein
MKKFTVLNTALAADSEVKVGDTVYEAQMHDYGLARDDTRHRGFEHVSVTFEEDGGYPFFTIPLRDLKEVK